VNAFVFRHLHLGDKLVSCIALQSLAVQMESRIGVGGCGEAKTLVESLGLDMLEWKEGLEPAGKNLRLMDFFSFLSGAKIPFFTSLSFAVDFEPPKIERICLPKFDVPRSEITLFQFDSRSPNENKRRLTRKECMHFLCRKARFRPLGIGGRDTKKELPHEYLLGGLKFIIQSMKSAGQFVGVDSGMSHIAGVLGIPSDIYLMHTNESDIRTVERFYREFYPNTICSHDFSTDGGRVPRLKIF
jgi:hypothetical protein